MSKNKDELSEYFWLLVENVNRPGPSYEVVGIHPTMCRGREIRTGRLIYIRTQYDAETRQVLIRAISDNRRDMAIQRKRLEQNETRYNSVVTQSSEPAKRKLSSPPDQFQPICRAVEPHSSNSVSRPRASSPSDSSSTDEDIKKFNELVQSLAKFSAHIRRNGRGPPAPGCINPHFEKCREQIKRTIDQSTQTDKPGPSNGKKKFNQYEDHFTLLEGRIRLLYKEFRKLITVVDENGKPLPNQSDSSLDISDNEASARRDIPPEQALVEIAARMKEHEQLIRREVENMEAVAGPSRPRVFRARPQRRMSAQTINNEDIMNRRRNDLVPIGHGNARVRARVLEAINWNDAAIATRQLLQAVFPRKVIAKSALTARPNPQYPHLPPKRILDPVLVNDIVLTITQRCPGATPELIRGWITAKCAAEAKLYRNRMICVNGRIIDPYRRVPPSPPSTDSSD